MNFFSFFLKKKAQLTIFLLFGIVLLFVVFFLFFLRNSLIKETYVQEVDSSTKAILSQSFESYFKSCVSSQLNILLDDFFLHGGFLPTSKGGPFKDEDDVFLYSPDLSFSLSKGLLSRTLPIYSIPKNFKGSQTLGVQGFMTKSIYGEPTGVFNKDLSSSYFGQVILPKLCLINGSNNPLEDYSKFSCMPILYNSGSKTENITAQDFLATALLSRVRTCLQDSKMNDYYTFSGSLESSSLIFGEDTVYVHFNGDLFYMDSKRKKNVPLDFTFPLRIKKLYSFVYDLLWRDSKDILFDIETDYKDSSFYDPSFEVTFLKNHLMQFNSSLDGMGLLIVEDKKSSLDFIDLSYDSQYFLNEGLKRSFLTFATLIEDRRFFLEVIPDQKEIISDDVSSISHSDTERNHTFRVQIYDPDFVVLNHSEIKFTLDVLNIYDEQGFSNEDLVFDPLSLSHFSITPIPSGFVFSFVSRCSSYCIYDPLGNDDRFDINNYKKTNYFFNLTVSDGRHFDFQEFSLELIP